MTFCPGARRARLTRTLACMSLRIISGTCRGKRLKTIPGVSVRPTSDKVREAIFNILQNRVANRRVADLFCGTGAMGLEALSRGAGRAVFVDLARPSLAAARQNIHWPAISRTGPTSSNGTSPRT